MALLVIESQQNGECFDCGEMGKIYAVQRVLSFGNTDEPSLPPSVLMEVEKLAEQNKLICTGWLWKPTCKTCAAEHVNDD